MGLPVGTLLRSTSSRELSEWKVFEQEEGDLGRTWDRMVLREIHYLLQVQVHQFASANSEKKTKLKEPERLPLPNEWAESDDEDE